MVSLSISTFDNPTGFNDRKGFATKFNVESVSIGELEELNRQARNFIASLYTYRSCAKAIPVVKEINMAVKHEIHRKTVEILLPQMQKMKDLMNFCDTAVKRFLHHLNILMGLEKQKEPLSEYTSMVLITLLDNLIVLDSLKNIKSSLMNDFTAYRRAFTNIQNELAGRGDMMQDDMAAFSAFLATQSVFLVRLKMELHKPEYTGFEPVFHHLMTRCLDIIQSTEEVMLPQTKFSCQRVLIYSIFLMDDSASNIFKSKKIKLDKFQKIIKRYPILPIFADMHLEADGVLGRCTGFDEVKDQFIPTTEKELAKVRAEYDLPSKVQGFVATHNDFVARFTLKMSQKEPEVTDAFRADCVSLMIQGLRLLSTWTIAITEQMTYKFANAIPVDPSEMSLDPKERRTDYERAVRYNFNSVEKTAMIETISLIKGLGDLLLRHEATLAQLIRKYVYERTQDFIHNTTHKIFRHCIKKSRPLASILREMREIVMDWDFSAAPTLPNDSAIIAMKEGPDKRFYPSRVVSTGVTQLQIFRSMVLTLVDDRGAGTQGGMFSDGDFTKDQAKDLKAFALLSGRFPILLNFRESVALSSDLSQLWYREFYLELAKQVQFPIDMSLPWILTQHALRAMETPLVESVFFMMDLYNDAAERTVSVFNQSYLFQEIEAEVNLAFDQLVYLVSDGLFSFCKNRAASLIIDYEFKRQTVAKKACDNTCWMSTLLRHTHLHLLGRNNNFRELVGERVANMIRRNLEIAVMRFESGDLTSSVDLECMLENARHTHMLMSEYVTLDAFEDYFAEADDSINAVSFHGRIALHVAFELLFDLLPNFSYDTTTQRFVRSHETGPNVQRNPSPKGVSAVFLYGSKLSNSAFLLRNEPFSRFFGSPHIQSLIRIVRASRLPMIVLEITRYLIDRVGSVLLPYVNALFEGLPAGMHLPSVELGTLGCYGYFSLKLKEIAEYPPLRSEVFQTFRELGNALAFFQLLDSVLISSQLFDFIQIVPFVSVRVASSGENRR